MGSLNELKSKNTMEILKLIWNKDSFTKPGIAELTNLTGVTVHKAINELLAGGLIVEQGAAQSNGGRKATLYGLNASYGFIAGVLMGIGSVHIGLFDLKLGLLYSRACERSLDYTPSAADELAAEITEAIALSGLDVRDCMAVGFSMPGQIDREDGAVIHLPNVPGWRDIPLKRLMEERLRLPVRVDNDNNGSMLAAKWLHLVGEDADAAFLTISEGVGAGVMSRGRIVYGKHSNVGEIGHITVRYDGNLCNCGGEGCLEAYAANGAVLARLRGAGGRSGGSSAEESLDRLAERALQGDAELYNIFRETGAYIGLALDIVVKAYDPETIVVESPWLRRFPAIFAETVDRLYARNAWLHNGSLKIKLNAVPHIDRVGPAALVLEDLLSSPDGNPLIQKISTGA